LGDLKKEYEPQKKKLCPTWIGEDFPQGGETWGTRPEKNPRRKEKAITREKKKKITNKKGKGEGTSVVAEGGFRGKGKYCQKEKKKPL